jgi:CelD/BcsL family acetyltransferase involved in cellulose biosynthesis
MEKYFQAFSGKSRKQILSGIRRIRDRGLTWRYDRFEDLDLMIAMNISRFGNRSYFHDRRFRRGFTWMLRYFEDREWLKVTTALVDGEVAAVDAGVLFDGSYTLMAGGTNPSFPGIAKVINMRHMERACEEGFAEVDFLCGDFNWKKMFHLHERPLYLAADYSVQAA